jgi:hypothetical protein
MMSFLNEHALLTDWYNRSPQLQVPNASFLYYIKFEQALFPTVLDRQRPRHGLQLPKRGISFQE